MDKRKWAIFALSLAAAALFADGNQIDTTYFSEGLCPMYDTASGLFGYIDPKGTWKIAPRWNYALPFSEGLGLVKRWGAASGAWLVDKSGKEVVDLSAYEWILGVGVSDGLVVAKPRGVDGAFAVLDKAGKEKCRIAAQYVDEGYSDGLLKFGTKDMKWGFADPSGNIVIAPTWDVAWPFSGGRAFVKTRAGGGKIVCIDKKGKAQFELPGATFVEINWEGGLAVVSYPAKAGSEYRVIDSAGTRLSSMTSANAKEWKPIRILGTLLAVSRLDSGAWVTRLVNPLTLEPVGEASFSNVGPFREGMAAATSPAGLGFIDLTGKWLIAPTWQLMPMGPM
jgi:hypothetical protein